MQNNQLAHSKINQIKKKIYQRAIVIGLFVIPMVFTTFYFEKSLTTFDWFIYPIVFIFDIVSIIVFTKKGTWFIKPFEYIWFATIFIVFLSQFAVLLGKLSTGSIPDFGEYFLWIAVIYILAFLIFPVHRALQLSITFLFGLLVIGLVYGFNDWRNANFGKELSYLIQVYGSSVIYIVLLYAISMLKDQYTESEIRSELITSIASTDPLTGAQSRAKSSELLDFYIAQAQSHGHSLSVVMLDVDKLKHVNDNFGHDKGDYVLRRIVELLRSNLRENDFLGRWGGDEFLLICPGSDEKIIRLLANRLELSISPDEFADVGSPSISAGVATYHPGDTPENLMKRADIEMYEQKRNKRQTASIQIQKSTG